jgi:hypothetical protein
MPDATARPRKTSYPAARVAAPAVLEHMAAHLAQAREHGLHDFAPQPDAQVVEAIIDASFWASLQREEGHWPKISLAYVPPDEGANGMVLERTIPLRARELARLAPAVEGPGTHLGVWPEGDVLRVWGTTRSVPTLTFVLEVMEPGLLVVKYRRGDELDKFGTIAVLQGEQVRVVDEAGASIPDCPTLLHALLDFQAPARAAGPAEVLTQLAVAMRAHGRGGSLLVVPGDGDAWHASVARPIPYRVRPAAALAGLLRVPEAERGGTLWRDAFRRAVEGVARLTAVDGATVVNERYELLAFGVKIVRRRGMGRVEQVAVTEPVVGNVSTVVDPSRLGGTRHLSAAQFVHDQRDALALVASQDGRFTVFAWSPCEDRVHAHRVEALLM